MSIFSDKQSAEDDPFITKQPSESHDPNFLSEGVRFGDLSQTEKAEFT
jgi:hypothetical protein